MPAVVRPVDDERDALLTFLAQQRHVIRVAAHGLTDGEAASNPIPSALTIGSLLKHLTTVERSWAAAIEKAPTLESEDRSFSMSEGESLASVVDGYERACAATNAVVAAVGNLDQSVPVPAGARWAPPDIDGWSVRWVLLHLIQETARHAGHADLIREAIDGATAFPLMAAVEGWPERRTIRPWHRDTSV